MAEETEAGEGGGPGAGETAVPMPVMQRILDNPFLLLFLGVVMPTVFYIIWGIMEIAMIPVSQ